uniref:Carbohydrate sulfotransferase n=1 Tax=Caligus rogercresseyi TaxID=217165 RepID=C1BNF5_CALRO|nr:Carbohydrate sulfotransferase 11 [Caligus rogercresseyi]
MKWAYSLSTLLITVLIFYIFLEIKYLRHFSSSPQELTPEATKEDSYQLKLFSQRREYTRKQCLSSNGSSLDLKHVLLDEERKLLFCVVPKVACTNWKRVLISLETRMNLTEIKYPHSHTFKTLSQSTLQEKALSKYSKFIFVRHPYERLVSAYENKVHRPFTNYFRSRLLREGMRDLSFPSFVDFILSKKPRDLNEHWSPQYMLCRPCQVDYDYIGRYETMKEDSDYILEDVLHLNVSLPKNQSQSPIGRTVMITPIYLRKLSSAAREGLFQLYKRDFELFGYKFPNWVNDNKKTG